MCTLGQPFGTGQDSLWTFFSSFSLLASAFRIHTKKKRKNLARKGARPSDLVEDLRRFPFFFFATNTHRHRAANRPDRQSPKQTPQAIKMTSTTKLFIGYVAGASGSTVAQCGSQKKHFPSDVSSSCSGLAWHTEETTLRQKFEEFGVVDEAVRVLQKLFFVCLCVLACVCVCLCGSMLCAGNGARKPFERGNSRLSTFARQCSSCSLNKWIQY